MAKDIESVIQILLENPIDFFYSVKYNPSQKVTYLYYIKNQQDATLAVFF